MIFDLIKRVCNSLNSNNIPYMISGSIALNIYTVPRLTRDIDIVIELLPEQIDKFVSLFPDSYVEKNTILCEIQRQGMFNVIDNQTGFKIDFIFRKNTEYFKLAFSRRFKVHEFGTEICVITIEDLIIAKIIWIQQLKSEKQIFDIDNLLLEKNIDMDYIKHWCDKLNLVTFNLFNNE